MVKVVKAPTDKLVDEFVFLCPSCLEIHVFRTRGPGKIQKFDKDELTVEGRIGCGVRIKNGVLYYDDKIVDGVKF